MAKKLLVQKIFSRKNGWDYSEEEVPLVEAATDDGTPVFIVNVDGIEIMVFQVTEWHEEVSSEFAPDRIVALTNFEGLEVIDPLVFLQANDNTHGLPLFSIDEDGLLTLKATFPVSTDFPVKIARGQLLVCLGLISEAAIELLSEASEEVQEVNWDNANKVAKVAGTFLGALFGLSG